MNSPIVNTETLTLRGRLSYLQKQILINLYKEPNEKYDRDNYSHILHKVALTMQKGFVSTINCKEDSFYTVKLKREGFRVSFSRSIRTLKKKGLIRTIYACNLPKWDFHSVKATCPEHECEISKMLNVSGHSHNSYFHGEKCEYFTTSGSRGVARKKSKIIRLELTQMGEWLANKITTKQPTP